MEVRDKDNFHRVIPITAQCSHIQWEGSFSREGEEIWELRQTANGNSFHFLPSANCTATLSILVSGESFLIRIWAVQFPSLWWLTGRRKERFWQVLVLFSETWHWVRECWCVTSPQWYWTSCIEIAVIFKFSAQFSQNFIENRFSNLTSKF